MMTKEAFIGMVKSHDLTFMYSDDAGVRQRGYDSLGRIKDAASYFPRAFVVKVWNDNVDSYLQEPYRKEFYWK